MERQRPALLRLAFERLKLRRIHMSSMEDRSVGGHLDERCICVVLLYLVVEDAVEMCVSLSGNTKASA